MDFSRDLQGKVLRGSAAGVLFLALGVSQAWPASINFLISNTPTTVGSVSFGGGATDPLVGAGIEVDLVVGVDTPVNPGLGRFCIECSLSFATGQFVGGGPAGWAFSGGGVISLTGGVDFTGDGDALDAGDIPTGTLLLIGGFLDTPVAVDLNPLNNLVQGFTFASFLDFKNPLLSSFYGLPPPPPTPFIGNFFIGIQGIGNAPGAFAAGVTDGFITNTPVPEPGTLFLLGSGLLGLAGSRLRRKK